MKLVLATLILVVSAATAVAGGDTRLTLPVGGMSCEGCANQIEDGLGKVAGVRHVSADAKARRVIVRFDAARTSAAAIRTAIEGLGYVIGDDDPRVAYPEGADVRTISRRGEDVAIERHLAAGKVTIVDYYADWCKPCKALERRIARRMIGEVDRLAVRRINVVDWDSPIAKGHLKTVRGLPYVRVYDERGVHVVSLAQDGVDKLDAHLTKLLPSRPARGAR